MSDSEGDSNKISADRITREEKRKKNEESHEFQKRWPYKDQGLVSDSFQYFPRYGGTMDITGMPDLLKQVGIEEVGGKRINKINEFFGYPSELPNDARVEVEGEFLWSFYGIESYPITPYPTYISERRRINVNYDAEGPSNSSRQAYSGTLGAGYMKKGKFYFDKNLSNEKESYYYEGQFENGKPNGVGKLRIKMPEDRNLVYEGPCLNGIKHGNGRITSLKLGQSYICEFENGVETEASRARRKASDIKVTEALEMAQDLRKNKLRMEEEKRKEDRRKTEQRRKEEERKTEEQKREEEERIGKQIEKNRKSSEFQRRWIHGDQKLLMNFGERCVYSGTMDITDVPDLLKQVGIEEVGGKRINKINEFFGYYSELPENARIEVKGAFIWYFSGEKPLPSSISGNEKIDVNYNAKSPRSSGQTYIGHLPYDGRGKFYFDRNPNNEEKSYYYEGEFKGNKPKGRGLLRIQLPEDKDLVYEGPCLDGKKHWKGKITSLESGFSYECEFENGVETEASRAERKILSESLEAARNIKKGNERKREWIEKNKENSEFRKRWLGEPQLIREPEDGAQCSYKGTMDITGVPDLLKQVGIEEVDGKRINKICEFFGYPSEPSKNTKVEVKGTFIWDFSEEELQPPAISNEIIDVVYNAEPPYSPRQTYRGTAPDKYLPYGEGKFYFDRNLLDEKKSYYYKGQFEDNEPKGVGKLHIHLPEDRDLVYDGPCLNGRKHGKGTITSLESGHSYNCEFKNGVETVTSKSRWMTSGILGGHWADVGNSVGRFLRNTVRLGQSRRNSELMEAGAEIEDQTGSKKAKGRP